MNNLSKNVKYIVVAAFLVIAIICLVLMGKVGINYNISDYLDEETETKISLGIIEEEFGLSGDAQVMIEGVDVSEAKKIKSIIEGVDGVVAVSFDENSTDFYKDNNALFTVLLEGDEYSNSARGAVADIEDVLDDTYGSRLHMGGTVAEKIALRNAIQTEIALILAISLCLVAVLMLITAKSWLEPFVILASSGVAVLLNMGTNIIFGEISYITNAVAAILQLALSMDYSIMLLHSYREKKKSEADINVAMISAIKDVVRPVSASALTTIAGLLALLFMSFRIGFDIGIVLMKSIVCSAFASLTLLPALLLIFDGLLAKTEKCEFVLSGKPFASLAFKASKIVAPVAIAIVAVCCFLQMGNSYSFTDASNKNEAIVDAFGENGTIIVVYEITDDAVAKEREFAKLLATYKKENGSPILKKITSLSSTVKEEYDVKAAATTLGISEDRAELLFSVYYLRENKDSVRMTALGFIGFANELINGDPDAAGLADEDVKRALAALNAAGAVMNGENTSDEFFDLISESGFVTDEEKLQSLKPMIEQMYGLMLYDEIEDTDVAMSEILDFITKAAQNPLTSGFITPEMADTIKSLFNDLESTKQELASKKDEITAQKAELVATKEEITAQRAELVEQRAGLVKQRQELIKTKNDITAQRAELVAKKSELETTKAELLATKEEVLDALEQLEPIRKALALAGAKDALAEINAKIDEANAGLAQIEDGLKQIEDGFVQINNGIAQIDAGVIEINGYLTQINEGLPKIDDGISQIDAGLIEIDGYLAQIEDGFLQIEEGFKIIEEIESSLNAEYSYEEFSEALSALGMEGDIPTEAIQQLYILYFNEKGMIPDEAVLGSDFVDFILDAAETNGVIGGFVSEETKAMLELLVTVGNFTADTEEYTYGEMTEKLGELMAEVPEMGDSEEISEDLLMGIYAKYAVSEKIFDGKTISAETLVSFLSSGDLPLVTLTEEQMEAVSAARTALESGKKLLVGENYTRLLLSVDLPAESADSYKFSSDVTALTKQIFGESAHVAGEIMSTNDLRVAFDFDNKLISIFTIVSIFLIIMLVFKSISLPVLLVAVIQGAIWIAMSTSLITGPMFFMSYIMTICILMGATIDYGILMSTSYVNARATMDKKEALARALELAMPTVFTSGLILMICGFVVGLIASQTAISSVGFLLFKGTLISTVMITVVLPSLLYLLDGFILKLTLKKKK